MTPMMEGHVDIPLRGSTFTLVPSLGAACELNRRHQSFGALLAKLEAYDLAASADVVHCGLGRTAEDREMSEEEVYDTGLLDLAPLLIRYVILLANGGRPIRPEGDGEEKSGGPFAA